MRSGSPTPNPGSRRQRPGRLAIVVVGLAAGLAILAPSGSGLGPGEAYACNGAGVNPGNLKPAKAQRAVICLVNRRRANRNRARLSLRKPLRTAAKAYSRRMRNGRCFGHTCGSTLLQRVRRTSYLPCNCTYSLGETIAWGASVKGKPRRIVKAWMRSAPHRSTLMNRSFRHIGVGVVWGSPRRPHSQRHGTYTAILGFKG